MLKSNCKICGDFRIKPCFENDSRVLRCQNCGVAFLSPEIIDYKPQDYYSNAPHYGRIAYDKKRLEIIKKIAKKNLKIISKYISSGKTLLDVGAHTGTFVAEAAKAGFGAQGIDLNLASVKRAKELGIPIEHLSIENFKSDKLFDIVTIFDVIEHLADPMAALKKINDLLSVGGYFIVNTPDVNSYFAKKYGIFWRHIDLEHFFYFSKKSLSKILENLGFKVVAVKNNVFELEYEWGIRRICRYILGKEKRNGFVPKADFVVRATELNGENMIVKFTKKLIKHLLIVFITLFGLADNVLIIARKNQA